MRIIIDTNVLMSGIFWSGIPLKILTAWNENKFSLALSVEIIKEYERVSEILSKKYPKTGSAEILQIIINNSKVFATKKLSEQISRDPDDDKFIECALAAKTKIIVSGDKDLLDIKKFMDINILSPRDFYNTYL